MARLENRVMRLRYMTLLAVISSMLGAALLFILGVHKTLLAFSTYLSPPVEGTMPPADQAISYLIQSMDDFLIGLVFLVFGYGVNTLFIRGVESPPVGEGQFLGGVRIRSVEQLKGILGELVVIVLIVRFMEIALLNLNALDWTLLVLPAAILMLALALKFLDLKKSG